MCIKIGARGIYRNYFFGIKVYWRKIPVWGTQTRAHSNNIGNIMETFMGGHEHNKIT